MKYFFVSIISISLSIASMDYKELLYSLKDDKSWVDIKQNNDGSIVKLKAIDGMNLSAISVESVIDVSPLVVQNILIDILNYNNVLKSSGALKTKLFNKNKNTLDGYQHIESGTPFISNRKYCFRMNYLPYSLNNNVLMEWYLLDTFGMHEKFIADNDVDAVYLDYGAGIWMVEQLDDKSFLFSYRLFMDPGGYIPNFIIEKVNELSIYNIFNDVMIEANKK